MEARTVDVEGIRMRWEEEGEEPPVVFIHGISPLRASGGM